jgi:hypothetical protein
MKIETAVKQRIIRNVFLSLIIYVLPIALLFLTLYVTGQRPWEKKTLKKEKARSVNTKNNLNNGSND